MDLDHIFCNVIGGFGRYQVMMTVTLSFVVFILRTFENEDFVFNFAPRFECRSNFNFSIVNVSETGIADVRLNHCFVWRDNQTALAHQLQEYQGLENVWNWMQLRRDRKLISKQTCDEWVFKQNTYSSTAVTDWNLVCVRSLFIPLADFVFEFGLATVCITGALIDVSGRRGCAGVAILLLFVAHCLCAFSFNYVMLIIARFATGTCISLIYVTCYVLTAEYVTASTRHHAIACMSYASAFAFVTQLLTSLFLSEWRVIVLFNAALALPTLAVFFLLESPRWLLVKNKRQKARAILAKVASINKTSFPCFLQLPVVNRLPLTSSKSVVTSSDVTEARTTLLRWKLAFVWIVVGLLNIDAFSDVTKHQVSINMHLLLTSLAVSVGVLCAQIMLTLRWGRRVAGVLLYFLATAIYLPRHLLNFRHDWQLYCVTIQLKVFVTAIENVLLVQTLELLPTSTRGRGVAQMYAVSRIVPMFRLTHALCVHHEPTSARIFIFLLSLAACFVHLLLPETRDAPLEDHEHAPRKPNTSTATDAMCDDVREDPQERTRIDDVTRSISIARSFDEPLWSTAHDIHNDVIE